MDVTKLRNKIIERWKSVDIQFVGFHTRSLALTLAIDEMITAAQEQALKDCKKHCDEGGVCGGESGERWWKLQSRKDFIVCPPK